jgi:hypothetical protein
LDYVTLNYLPGPVVIGLREVCGEDEQVVTGIGTMMAVRLLDRLLVPGNGADTTPVQPMNMTASDRDRLLATVYRRAYGPQIESTVRCIKCGELFDIDFSLPELQAFLADGARPTAYARESDGYFLLPDGRRFRLPTAEDELAVMGLTAHETTDELLKRCLEEQNRSSDNMDVIDAMAEIAPLMDMDLTCRCPECKHEQSVHFDIQTFLLRALEQEKNQLAWEVHRLASAYGWSLGEILRLPRSIRRTYVALVESEAPSRRKFSL